jgi:signal transduction histidine kinase
VSSDDLIIFAIAFACSLTVSIAGAAVVWFVRRRSVRWSVTLVGVVAVAAFIAALMGTARAMFLSGHDFGVVIRVGVIAGAVSVAFAAAMGQAVVRWSRSLQSAARDFGERGEFAPTGKGPAEFSQLAAELTHTSEKLKESRRRERNLESSRRELVAWVSHDLRTPLAGLRAMAEALEDGVAVDPARYHAQILSEVDRMTAMVDDLFQLSRIHSGALRLTVEELSVVDLVSETIAGADAVARARTVRLGGYAAEGVFVHADAEGISRVLRNLVMNAIRHTPPDGTVDIQAKLSGGAVEVVVSDECGGIPDADLPRVFDVAFRGSDARTPGEHSGAGLGLAIVKGIVEAHRGTVAVENRSSGCSFLVRLPA